MKTKPSSIYFVIALSFIIFKASAFAGTDVWIGGGGVSNIVWQFGANWVGGNVPAAGDQLVFTNTVSLTSSNNYVPATIFSGITFATPAGTFNLNGNSVTLTNNITDNQVVTPESINLPMVINSPLNLNVNVTASGVLNLSNVISGTGNLTNSGAGRVNLTGSNTVTGSLVINGGVVTVSQETNLPAAPITPTPGNIIINGGALEALAGFTINSNRGMAIGPTSGSGQGTISVNTESSTPNQYAVLNFGGTITNNGGGIGGLTKLGFGNLVLSGANTYTGTTSNQVGTLTLDFSKPGAPANNIISSNSPLVFGGANAGAGVTNFAQLVVTNSAAGTVSQTFNGTHVTIGTAIIRVQSGSGTANLTLGALDHDAGGVLAIIPPTLKGGSGNVLTTPTTTNLNGIIGGWATISDGNTVSGGWTTSTNWACVDGSGNITNYKNFTVYSSGYVKNIMAATNNLLIPSTATGTLTNDVDQTNGIYATYDVNTITFDRTDSGWTFQIGVSNILRLGTSGGLLKRTYGTSSTLNFGVSGSSGELTAGGPNIDTPGNIVLTSYQTDNANNNFYLYTPIVNNGAGAVTVVKSGSGYASLAAANSYTGGTYIEGGRLRFGAGGCYGYGPVYIFPGGYTYVNSTAVVTNDFFLSGSGSQQEPGNGAIRYGPNAAFFTGNITLIGDTEIGGQSGGGILGPISGPFKLILGATLTINGDTMLANTNNSWSGGTLITARTNSGVNSLTMSNSEVIPNGFGKGNVSMQGFSSGLIFWNMHGFNETINGLSTVSSNSIGSTITPANCIISNDVASTTSTLTVGNNDQSGTFAGILKAGSGTLALTKIGAGVETLTAANTYTGTTTISNGVLQLTASGTIANSPNVNINGGTFDISQIASYVIPSSQTINVAGGTFIIASASASSSSVNFTNGTLQIGSLNGAGDGSGTANLTASTVNIDAMGGFIKVGNTPRISAFPVAYPVIHYTTLNGSGTFSGLFPAGYGGYIVNSNAFSTVYVILTNGPVTPVITWKGLNGANLDSDWDVITPDWVSNTAPVDYVDGAIARFTDSGSTNYINITTATFPSGTGPTPGDTIVSNNMLTYTFGGSGGIGGTNHLFKEGSGTLILDNTGGDTYSGGLSISGGTVQLGNNDTGGSLGGGTVANSGTLIFDRANSDLVVASSISGSGLLTNESAGTTLTLSGANTFTGPVGIITGSTLQAGNNSALGSSTGASIPSGASLDVNGHNLGAAPVIVGGIGVLNNDGSTNGAIYNSSPASASPALARVTLTGDTVFGGALDDPGLSASSFSNRWDLRAPGGTTGDPGTASLTTSGGTDKITKIGNNFVGIVSATVSPNIGDIDINGGTLDFEGNTTGLGNPANTLTVESGTTFEMYSATNQLNKVISVSNQGNILGAGPSGNNTIIGPMTLNGQVNFNVNNGATLTLKGAIIDGASAGTLNYNGTNTLVVAGTDTHSGGTFVNGGIFVLNTKNNSAVNGLTNLSGATIGGNGTNFGEVDIQGTLFPSVSGKPSTFGVGNGSGLLEMDNGGSNPQLIISLGASTTAGGGVNDLVNVNGNLDGNNNGITINEVGPLQNGVYTLINYSGTLLSSFNNGVNKTLQNTRYVYSLNQGSGNNSQVTLTVSGAGTVLEWDNNSGDGLWNVNASSNWLNQTTSQQDIFDQLDTVVLDDSIIAAGVTNVISINTNSAASVTNNSVTPGYLIVNSTTNYVINGPGGIGGGASIVKMGTSTLTINNANSFTGGTTISNGILRINNTNALGGPSVAIVVTSGGTLDIGGAAFTANQAPLLGTKPVYIAGMGFNNKGAIINSSANAQENSAQNVIMTADAGIGGDGPINGAGRFDLGRITPATLSTGGHAYNLFKVGTNQVSLVNLTVDASLGNIDIQGGELGYEIGTTELGNPANTLTIESGATLEFFEATNSLNKVMIVNGGAMAQGLEPNIWFNGGGIPNNSIMGTVWITNGLVVVGGGASGTISNAISGPGSLRIAGAVYLDGTNTYTGDTSVSNNGTLFLVGTASIAQSTNITLLAGTIDVSGRTNTALTLAGQKLTGNGTINGTLTNNADATVTPSGGGSNSTNSLLTVTNNVTLLGTTVMNLNNTTNDQISVGGKITYGGTLNVTTNASGTTTLAAGENFKLFVSTNSGSFNGTFGTLNLPALPAGLNWTNGLAVDGSIGIVSSGAGTFSTPPGSLTFSLGTGPNAGNVTINGTGGQAGDAYYLLQSTNVALPLSQWNVVATNVLGANGSFTFIGTNVVAPGDNQQYYILSNTNSNHQ